MNKLKNDFWTYQKTCDIIKSFGVIPEEKPPEKILRRLQNIVDRCLLHYKPLPDDFTLKGVYIYREREQAGDSRYTYGNTQQVSDNEALIGLSLELLEYNDMSVFHDLVFVHELAHLTEWEHNEYFQDRFNDLEFDYYFYNRVRVDSKDFRKVNRKGWKM